MEHRSFHEPLIKKSLGKKQPLLTLSEMSVTAM